MYHFYQHTPNIHSFFFHFSSNCDWITYDNLGNGKIYGNPQAYQCPSITVVGGYCTLPWSQAVTQCNSDPQCAGIALTTNNNWHNAYNKNNEPAVQLLSNSAPHVTNTNTEWFMFYKKCWNFNT